MVSPGLEQIPLQPEIDLLVEFVNTVDVEADVDELREPAAAAEWLAGHPDASPEGVYEREEVRSLDAGEHERLIAFREALRALLGANNGGEAGEAETAPLREAAARSRYGAELGADGRLALAPRGDGAVERFEARALLAVGRIQDGGEWSRLKACPAGECQWAFFDTSRNRSRTWCSMGVCGNRQKTRRYRARGGVSPAS